MRALPVQLLAATMIFATTAMAQTIPPAALNPTVPARALSLDNNLPGDTDLRNDAATLSGIEPVDESTAAQVKVNNGHIRVDSLQQRLEKDIKMKADRATIKKDKVALSDAKKQLKLDQKACRTELKSNPEKVNAHLVVNGCK